jgi:hypothetical protein
MKRAQGVGLGLDTVTDRAVITVRDMRLGTMSYGSDFLAGCRRFPWCARR